MMHVVFSEISNDMVSWYCTSLSPKQPQKRYPLSINTVLWPVGGGGGELDRQALEAYLLIFP